jgi:hypothetical protein
VPVPIHIDQLSIIPELNSPPGGEDVFPQLDNYLRVHAAYIAQLREAYRTGGAVGGDAPSPLRPKFFLGPANAYTVGTEAFLDGATFLSGSTSNGKAGTFTLTTTAGNYGWLATVAAASAAGIQVFDGVGYGGWSGAGEAGNYSSGLSLDESSVTHTDSDGIEWRLFRQDYMHANPFSANYTTS